MNLSTLVVRDIEQTYGSLTHCVVALIRWAGGNATYRDVNAALGLSLRTVAVTHGTEPALWTTYACDRFLKDAAAHWGVRLRELHPPEAAEGLSGHTSFDQHFDASYLPLIRSALKHEQPVLAWQGWPDARAPLWGIITGECDERLGISGTTMWSHGRPVPLMRPAAQLYVVEEIDLNPPDDETLFRGAVARLATGLRGAGASDPAHSNVVWGDRAYEVWLERMEQYEQRTREQHEDGRGHVQHARGISDDRMAGMAFFRHFRDGADGEDRDLIDAILAECRGEIDVLGTLRDRHDVAVLIRTPQGRSALASGIAAARSFERALAGAVETLAKRIL